MKEKLWANGLHGQLNGAADDFNSSIAVDSRMYKEDIEGSAAHAEMLGRQGIIGVKDSEKIVVELKNIADDIEKGSIQIDYSAEDIHTFIENILVERIGDAGKKLHTARSRNDQVALDTRMCLSKEINEINRLIKKLINVIIDVAEQNYDAVMSGYTHLQQAQPITFAHWLTAYAAMFLRDIDRMGDCDKRTKISPLGSLALAGTSFDIDREFVAGKIGFDGVSLNSIDGVSDRDFLIEAAADIAIVMMHLSRFSEEVIIYGSKEFDYIAVSDGFSTGSSIMPQKKNPDIAELVRGKCGRAYGDLMTLLTVMKGLPLAYNKDMQEDKHAIFDSIDTVKSCLKIFAKMLSEITVNKDKMLISADKGFICATEVADYLVKKGMPFRTAYKVSGEIVSTCIQHNYTLTSLPLCMYRDKSELIGDDIYHAVDISAAVNKKTSMGAPAASAVKAAIEKIKKDLSEAVL